VFERGEEQARLRGVADRAQCEAGERDAPRRPGRAGVRRVRAPARAHGDDRPEEGGGQPEARGEQRGHAEAGGVGLLGEDRHETEAGG
jgi:hypothetical protein